MPSVQIAVNVLLDFFCLPVAALQTEFVQYAQTNMKSKYVEHSNLMYLFRIMLELEILAWTTVLGRVVSHTIARETLVKVALCLLALWGPIERIALPMQMERVYPAQIFLKMPSLLVLVPHTMLITACGHVIQTSFH